MKSILPWLLMVGIMAFHQGRAFGRNSITMNVQVAVTVDLVVPVDMSQRILSAGYFFEIGTSIGFVPGDQVSNLDHSQMMSTIVFEYRPVPGP